VDKKLKYTSLSKSLIKEERRCLMDSDSKKIKTGEIAISALGRMFREVVKANKERMAATKILEDVVLRILRQSQVDIRAVMDGVEEDPETGETMTSEVTIRETIDHDEKLH